MDSPPLSPTSGGSRRQQPLQSSLQSLSHASLQQIRAAFASTHTPGIATYPEAISIMSSYATQDAITAALERIDVNRTAAISFSDLANFLIAAQESLDFVARKGDAMDQFAHALTQPIHWSSIHRAAVNNLVYTTRPRGLVISGGRDGQVTLWDPATLECVTKIVHDCAENIR